MAYWKSSLGTLSKYFESEAQQNTAKGNKMERPGTILSEEVMNHSSAEVKDDLNAMIHDVWEEIFGHVLRSHPMIMEHLFFTAGSNAKKSLEVKVVKEVFKREMAIALERLYESRFKPDGKESSAEPFREEEDSASSLKESLREMTEKAAEAVKALQIATKEKQQLQAICKEYMEEKQKVAKMLQDAREENETLRKDNVSLSNSTKLLDAEMKDLRQAKGVQEVNALRSQHDAEMAHLIAKQSVLQAKLLDKQLREAESSSKIVQKQVEELQKVQNDMRSVLVNHSYPSESHVVGGQREFPMPRNSRPLAQLGVGLSRRKRKPNGGEANRRSGIEQHMPQGVHANTTDSSPSSTVRHVHNGEPTNRNPREVHRIAHRRFTSGDRAAGNGEARAAESREERGRILNRLSKLVREAPGNTPSGNHEAEAGRGLRGRLPWLAELGRVLSPSTYSQTSRARPSVDAHPQTLEALGENLVALRDVVDNKQKEVDRLRRELRAATLQSDALERRLRKEQHKHVEMKLGCARDIGASSAVGAGSGMHAEGEAGEKQGKRRRSQSVTVLSNSQKGC